MSWLLMLLLAAPVADAQPLEVVSGGDLVAWRALSERRLAPELEIEALRAFLVTYPTSPLAENALSRLHDLGAPQLDFAPEPVRRELGRVAASRSVHQAQLAHAATTPGIARLTPEGEAIGARPPQWQLALHAGGGWLGGPAGTVGVRFGRGPLSGVVRAGWLGDQIGLEGALRVGAWNQRFFSELALGTEQVIVGRLGGAIPLADAWALELTAGAGFDWTEGLFVPDAALAVTFRL